MLIGNQNVLTKHPGRDIGGGATGQGYEAGARRKSGMSRGAFYSESWDRKSGRPDGYPGGYSWIIPYEAGTMASRNLIVGTGALAAGIITSRSLSADLTGVGTVSDAQLALLTSLAAALSGSGTVTDAALDATLALTADLAGSGSLTAGMAMLVGLTAGLVGTGTISSAALRGDLSMTADILVAECADLTAAEVAAEVWNAVAASYDLPGTMGEKMNDAGSAANPWTEIIEAGYTAEELLRLMAAVLLGKASGGGTATRVFRDVNDTVDRVEATVETDGDRTAVNLDPT